MIVLTVEEITALHAKLIERTGGSHAFVDGNKRIGVFTMLMTLQLNSVAIHYTQGELVSLGLLVAAGEMDYESILAWILEHKI